MKANDNSYLYIGEWVLIGSYILGVLIKFETPELSLILTWSSKYNKIIKISINNGVLVPLNNLSLDYLNKYQYNHLLIIKSIEYHNFISEHNLSTLYLDGSTFSSYLNENT